MTETSRAGPIGRVLRAFVAVCVLIITVPVYLKAGWAYNLRSLAIVGLLILFYLLVHLLVSRVVPGLNRWGGAVLAITPVFLVWFFGQGGGPLFGQGEGGTAALTYISVSLLIDAARSDAGCEVMAIPGLLLKERTHLACLLFSPVDMLEGGQSA